MDSLSKWTPSAHELLQPMNTLNPLTPGSAACNSSQAPSDYMPQHLPISEASAGLPRPAAVARKGLLYAQLSHYNPLAPMGTYRQGPGPQSHHCHCPPQLCCKTWGGAHVHECTGEAQVYAHTGGFMYTCAQVGPMHVHGQPREGHAVSWFS